MTVDELEALTKKAEKTLGCSVSFGKLHAGVWWLNRYTGDPDDDIADATLTEVIAKLREWARPPKPPTLTVELPFDEAETYAKYGSLTALANACREALKPWTQS